MFEGQPPHGRGRPWEPQDVSSENASPPDPVVGGRRQPHIRLTTCAVGDRPHRTNERELAIMAPGAQTTQSEFKRQPWNLAHSFEGSRAGVRDLHDVSITRWWTGYTGTKILERSMSTRPDIRDQPLSQRGDAEKSRRRRCRQPSTQSDHEVCSAVIVEGPKSVLNVGKALYNTRSEVTTHTGISPNRCRLAFYPQRHISASSLRHPG